MPDLRLTPGVLLDQAHLTGDLSGGNGTDARLLECTVTEADLSEVHLGGARLTDTRFHAVRGTGLVAANSEWLDIPSLRGSSISRLQLIDLAPALAAQLGITVKD